MDQVSQNRPVVQQKTTENWQYQIQNRITSLDSLLNFPGWAGSFHASKLQKADQDALEKVSDRFKFAVTPYYLSLANPDDPDCPIIPQILANPAEAADTLFHRTDPLLEEEHMPVRNLTHRYPDRVLWYTSHTCAVYCRYCMRKRKVSDPVSMTAQNEFAAGINYIEDHPEISEVILSGGDPLSLSDSVLKRLLDSLSDIRHLASVRIHTRMPVTLPARFTDDLLSILSGIENITIVTHFNSAVEITKQSTAAVQAVKKTGTTVRNQSVLLKGVNDTTAKLQALFLGLLKIGVHPYYLHQCDEISGVSHFRVPLSKGIALMKTLRGRIPGIAIPQYVIDLPGGGGKVPVDSSYKLKLNEDGSALYENYSGRVCQTSADSPT